MRISRRTEVQDARLGGELRLRIGPCAGVICGALLFAGCERVDRGPAVALRQDEPVKPVDRAEPHYVRPRQPPVRKVELGRSVRGTPLVLEVFGDGPDRVLIFGGIHGDEPTSAELARRLADHLRINWHLFSSRTVAILAVANPDGLAAGRRTNANGVDLNRNFPAKNWRTARGKSGRHGSKPTSEPETQAILRAIELIRPDRIIAVHAARPGRHCNNYDGPARELAGLLARHNAYPVKASMGYPTPGSFGSWAGVDHRIPTITLELPGGQAGVQSWRDNQAGLLAFIDADALAVDVAK
jgi:protein MpaA